MKQTNTTGHLFIGNVSQHRVELNVILSLLLLFHRGKNGDRNNKQIRGEEKLSYVVSRFAYFHHIFQSHAEYLDYLNRLFAHFFPRLRHRPFVGSLIFFHSFVYSFAIPFRLTKNKTWKTVTSCTNDTQMSHCWNKWTLMEEWQFAVALNRIEHFMIHCRNIDGCLYFIGNNKLYI